MQRHLPPPSRPVTWPTSAPLRSRSARLNVSTASWRTRSTAAAVCAKMRSTNPVSVRIQSSQYFDFDKNDNLISVHGTFWIIFATLFAFPQFCQSWIMESEHQPHISKRNILNISMAYLHNYTMCLYIFIMEANTTLSICVLEWIFQDTQ